MPGKHIRWGGGSAVRSSRSLCSRVCAAAADGDLVHRELSRGDGALDMFAEVAVRTVGLRGPR